MSKQGPEYVCNKTSFRKAFRFPSNEEYFTRLIILVIPCSALTRHASILFKCYVLSDPNFESSPEDYKKVYLIIMYPLNSTYSTRNREDQLLVNELLPLVTNYIKDIQFVKPQ